LQNLKDAFANKIPIWKKEQNEVVSRYGNKLLATCSVEQAYGGMRSVKSMVYDTSVLDPIEVWVEKFHWHDFVINSIFATETTHIAF
jgi:hypothetical protein